jgi:proteasome lid subunit RPN8/RPN11
MSAISLSQEDLDLIRRDGALNYPDECCGFLFGLSPALKSGEQADEARVVTEVQPIGNEQNENRARRFLISPEQFRKAENYARVLGLELLGFYHTHPDHPAVPSEFDREHALPFYSYVILSVRKGEAAELRSWQLDLDRSGYVEEAVHIKAEILG